MTSAQKIPFVRSMSTFGKQKSLDEIAKLGLAIPGTVKAVLGAIVTVNFEVSGLTLPEVQMPLAGPEYIRYPITIGDKGLAVPASVYLGGVSGLGGGTADDTLRGNLSTLFWMPLGNANWTTVNPLQTTIYGPDGVLIRDTADTASASVTTAEVLLSVGSNTILVDTAGITLSNGTHTITINSTGVVIDGRIFLAHEHLPGTLVAGSTPVTGDSGAVV